MQLPVVWSHPGMGIKEKYIVYAYARKLDSRLTSERA